jgi:hypothetical protein
MKCTAREPNLRSGELCFSIACRDFDECNALLGIQLHANLVSHGPRSEREPVNMEQPQTGDNVCAFLGRREREGRGGFVVQDLLRTVRTSDWPCVCTVLRT